jgi:hypothetical protein
MLALNLMDYINSWRISGCKIVNIAALNIKNSCGVILVIDH